MSPKSPPAVVAAFILLFALPFGLPGQEEASGQESTPSPLRTFFTGRSAKVDETIDESVRKSFEVDDGGPLKSVSVDLNADGRDEKIILNSLSAMSGGSQWLVYDQTHGISRGLIIGAIIFILRENDESYPRIESYWKQGGEMAIVFEYRYSRGRYVRIRSRSLNVPEIDEYFRAKPPLDLDQELMEIRRPGQDSM